MGHTKCFMNTFKIGDRVSIGSLETGVIVAPIEGTRTYHVKLDINSEIIEVTSGDLVLIED